MKKRVLSLLLALVLLLGLVPGALALEDADIDPGMGIDPIGMPDGEGTEESPLLIGNAEQLAWFAQTISDPTQGAQEVCAALTADIDLENEPWMPMGTDSYGYKGTFDGQGHTISGLNVSNVEYAGLFACVDGGTVKNLVVSGSVSGTSHTGAIAGYVKNNAAILRCGNEAAVTGSGNYTGGIAGQAGANDKVNTIEQCYNAGSVTGSGNYAGGILGHDMGKAAINDCYNTGTISGAKYAGGIRAYLSSFAGKISNCYNAGTVTGQTVGAIASGSYDGENCYAVTGGVITPDGSAQTLTQAQLLAALANGRENVWKQDAAMNGGNPTLFWQKAEAEEEIGNYVRFAREMVTTLDGDETSLPTALLKWSAQEDASGYVVGLWQKVRVWKGLTDEELEKLTTEPTGPVDSWSRRLLQLDQNAIIAKFSDEQKQELLRLQTII